MFRDQLSITFTQIRDGVHPNVRTCTPLYHVSQTAGGLRSKFGLWLGIYSTYHKSDVVSHMSLIPGSCWGISPPATRWGGGGVKRPQPHVITRERMAAERRATRRSKALNETILKHPLNFSNEVTCQVKVRSKVKIGAFRLRAVETSKLSVLGQNLLRILLKYM